MSDGSTASAGGGGNQMVGSAARLSFPDMYAEMPVPANDLQQSNNELDLLLCV